MIRTLLLVLAVARATRFVTTDWLGFWTIRQPAQEWAMKHEVALLDQATKALEENPDADGVLPKMVEEYDPGEPWSWQAKLVKGLDCPFCVGFWIGGLALLGELTIARVPVLGAVWRFGVASFALNYVTGHLNAKID